MTTTYLHPAQIPTNLPTGQLQEAFHFAVAHLELENLQSPQAGLSFLNQLEAEGVDSLIEALQNHPGPIGDMYRAGELTPLELWRAMSQRALDPGELALKLGSPLPIERPVPTAFYKWPVMVNLTEAMAKAAGVNDLMSSLEAYRRCKDWVTALLAKELAHLARSGKVEVTWPDLLTYRDALQAGKPNPYHTTYGLAVEAEYRRLNAVSPLIWESKHGPELYSRPRTIEHLVRARSGYRLLMAQNLAGKSGQSQAVTLRILGGKLEVDFGELTLTDLSWKSGLPLLQMGPDLKTLWGDALDAAFSRGDYWPLLAYRGWELTQPFLGQIQDPKSFLGASYPLKSLQSWVDTLQKDPVIGALAGKMGFEQPTPGPWMERVLGLGLTHRKVSQNGIKKTRSCLWCDPDWLALLA